MSVDPQTTKPKTVDWGYGWTFGRSGTPITRDQYPEWIDPDEFERGIRDGAKENPFRGAENANT